MTQGFRYLGKGQVGIVDLTTSPPARRATGRRAAGRHEIRSDRRPPVTGGKLVSFDPDAALKVHPASRR